MMVPSCALPGQVATHPALLAWSGEAQKLYLWLRATVARSVSVLSPDAQAWHAQGYLVVTASSDVLRAQALPVSRNTLGKVVRELETIGACGVRSNHRGYIFLLGEWEERPSRATGRPVYVEGFYADRLLWPGPGETKT